MNKNQIDNYLIKTWRFLLLASFTIPLYLYSKMFFPFISTKAIVFRVLIELAFLIAVILWFRGKLSLPPKSKILYAVLGYLAAMSLASLFGVDLYRSFWSTVERSDGLLLLLHLTAFFVMLPMAFPKPENWKKVFWTTGIVSLLVSLFGLMQHLQVPFLLPSSGGGRLASTIGNAAFLGAYLLPHIFLFIWAAIKNKVMWQRILLAAAALFEIFILFQTETRGAVLGLLVGLLTLGVVGVAASWKGGNKKTKQLTTGALIALVLLSAGLYLARDTNFVQNNATLNRVTNLSISDTTARNRLVTWEASWKAFKDRPIFGYGYENYNVGFNRYFPAVIFEDLGSQIWFDRAHNVVFDQLVTGGIVGFIAWLAIFVFALMVIYKQFKKGHILRGGILLAILVSYLFQNLFVFDTPSTYILLFGLLAYLYLLSSEQDFESIYQGKKSEWAPLGIGAGVLAVILALVFWNLIPYKDNRVIALAGAYERGVISPGITDAQRQQGKIKVAQLYNEAAESGSVVRIEAGQKLAEFMLVRSNGMPEEDYRHYMEEAIAAVERNVAQQPKNVFHYIQLMSLYNKAAAYEPSYAQKALQIAPKAEKLSPTRPHVYYEQGQANLRLGNSAEAIAAFEQAVAVNPDPFETQWNLGLAYALTGDSQKAWEKIEYLKQTGYKNRLNGASYIHLSRAFSQNGDHADAERAARLALELDNQNWEFWLNLSLALYRQGKIDMAIEALQPIKQLQPSTVEQINTIESQMRSGTFGT